MKHLVLAPLLVSACGASMGDPASGGGDQGDPGVGTANAHFKLTKIHDERQDRIEFGSGEPVHVHVGSEAMLGGVECPDVYKYSYLMETPKFGREMTANPLAFTVNAAEYRIRFGETAIVDWSPVIDDAITVSRAVAGDRTGMFFVDIRDGKEMATACWNHHPLQAPVEVQDPQLDSAGLAGMKLTTDSPISKLLSLIDVPVLATRIVHHTAEAVTLDIAMMKPAATYSRRAVDDFVVSRTGTSGEMCARTTDGFESTEPVCQPEGFGIADPSDTVRAGVLAIPAWTLAVIDEATNAVASNCTVSGLHATCQLAPRATTAAASAYRFVLAMRDAQELAPSTSGPYGEHTIAGLTFTGRVLETEQRCAQFHEVTKFGETVTSCQTFIEYTHIQALDRAQMTFAATPITINGAPHDAAPFVWDAGDDDLPGPQ